MAQNIPPSESLRRQRRRRIMGFGGIMLVLAVGVAIFARREMGGALARKLDERLSAQGIYAAWESADWVPGPGIQVHGLILYFDAAKSRRLASIGNVTVIKGDPEWNRWDTMEIRVADAVLILGEGECETKLDHLGASLWIEPGKIDLRDCHAKWQGLSVEVVGSHGFTTKAGGVRGEGAFEPALENKGRFDGIDLAWLQTAKQWASVQPQKDEPLLKAEFHSLPDGGGLELNATLSGKEFQWLGQSWDLVDAAAKTTIGNSKSIIEIDRAKFGFGGRSAELSGEFDPTGSVTRIKRLQSTIDVLAFVKAFVPEAAKELSTITSTGSWLFNGQGEIPMNQPGDSRWNGRVNLDGDLVQNTTRARVALKKPSCTVRLEKREFSMSGLKAGLWEGKLSAPKAKIRLATAKTRTRFEAQFTLVDARLESVMSCFGPAEKQPGTVQFNWSGAGAFDLASFTGNGTLSIKGAEFGRVPLFGTMARLLDKLSPGFGRDQTSKVEGTHRISKGILHLENLTLENAQTKIDAEGTVDLKRRYADLTSKARMKGVLGFVATALAGGIDATGKGPVGDVKWER
jgi:hypothetical protein